ncbi:PilZ domain-containing protein [bacterium LRH843]|nr:PilZ domain-containing protein [bacterium LRH843]
MNHLGGRYRRQEGFRLSFKQPIPATFTIIKMQEKTLESNKGSFHIIDMSLKGAKVISNLELPTPNTHIQMECMILKENLNITGELVWKKKTYEGFVYGVAFQFESYSERDLLRKLKKYVGKDIGMNE